MEETTLKPFDVTAERRTHFSNFSERVFMKLTDEPTFCTKFCKDGSLLANSFMDGSVKILSTQFNQVLY